MSKLLIIAGFLLIALGIFWSIAERFGITRLPGDFVIERENFRVYIPVAEPLRVSRRPFCLSHAALAASSI